MATNYSSILGIQNKWAPILFAVIYFLLMLWYLAQSVRRHAWVFSALVFFSALRVISFSLRAAMANNHANDAFSRKIAIAYEVLFNISIFSLLLSAYRLLHDRRRLAKINRTRDTGRGFLHRAMGGFHKGRIMELLLLLSVLLGAIGVALALGPNVRHTNVGNKLNDASTYIFLVVAVIIALLTILVIRIERSLRLTGAGTGTGTDTGTAAGTGTAAPSPIGATHHHLILSLIALLLLIRMLFYAATVHQRATGQQTTGSQALSFVRRTSQGNEHLWYPLAALAELLAVLLFLTPGLVPLRSLIARHRREGGAYTSEKAGANNGYTAGGPAATGGLGATDGTARNGVNTAV
ncbi:hypothetical protein B0H11DRAFT_194626 [Mycena galericulata]|nr:hypothetical protein B0H11DRAFT_194626 [Mycena galericulata]